MKKVIEIIRKLEKNMNEGTSMTNAYDIKYNHAMKVAASMLIINAINDYIYDDDSKMKKMLLNEYERTLKELVRLSGMKLSDIDSEIMDAAENISSGISAQLSNVGSKLKK